MVNTLGDMITAVDGSNLDELCLDLVEVPLYFLLQLIHCLYKALPQQWNLILNTYFKRFNLLEMS